MDLSNLLAAFRSKPKTLPQAQVTLDEAGATLGKIEALFSAAGLDMQAMLAAGPDSLKAHLDSLRAEDSKAAQAEAKVADLETQLTAVKGQLGAADAIFAAIGMTSGDGAEVMRSKFDAHVKSQAALELSKAGHPPVAAPATADEPTPKSQAEQDEEHLAAYEKLPKGDERAKFFAQHETAIHRAHIARQKAASR